MNIFKAALDTRHQNGVIGTVTQFDNAVLELQIVTDGQVSDAWEEPQFELIAMKRDANAVREVDQDRFTILSKEDHKVQIELKEQFLTCRGTVKMQLVIKEGSRLSTTLFYLVIGQSLDHDIVASYRDAKVLDDLDSLNQQAYDDLAFREQRYEEMEDSFTELNGKMNANEAERNAAETKRSQIFETNETNRTQTFNNQIEEQGIAFSNARTQREKDFSESQQNMSQEFEISQKERESDFNELQKSNQKTFETNEQKRQTAFNQSQTANQQDFVDNEAERQRLFESNESSRQKSESQRVQNESERVFAETQRADAEVIRQQKMTEFEEKATQLSEDLDSQVARVDEFVAANEEKLLGPHDKTDYMGNAHKSVKDANDANVEYILGEVNTVNYEGQHITATDTIEKQVRSAILTGQTLVNVLKKDFDFYSATNSANGDAVRYAYSEVAKANTLYTFIFYVIENSLTWETDGNFRWGNTMYDGKGIFANAKTIKFSQIPNAGGMFVLTNTSRSDYSPSTHGTQVSRAYIDTNSGGTLSLKVVMLEGDYTSNYQNITHFTGMQSVKMPVLTTTGKNLFDKDKANYIGAWLGTSGGINSLDRIKLYYVECEPNTTYTISKTLGKYFRVAYGNSIPKTDEVVSQVLVGDSAKSSLTITTNDVAKYLYFNVHDNSQDTLSEEEILSSVQLEVSSNATLYEPFKSNILSIDGEYRGIGDVCDTVDCITGEVVERIGEIVLDGSESIKMDYPNNLIDTLAFVITNTSKPNKDNGIIKCDKFQGVDGNTYWTQDKECIMSSSSGVKVRILRTKLSTQDINGMKLWLSQNNLTIQYQLATESIKTVDLSNQKIYSYDGTTHYSCSAAEGALIPTLSIDVPTNLSALVSRQRTTIESQKEQIITLEQENEQLIAQNEVQDIDISLNQDAINFMLFAPAAISVNNESRNNEGVNTMAAYLANQILKGKLDYALVVGRYGSYKEDIDTILIAEGKQDLIK